MKLIDETKTLIIETAIELENMQKQLDAKFKRSVLINIVDCPGGCYLYVLLDEVPIPIPLTMVINEKGNFKYYAGKAGIPNAYRVAIQRDTEDGLGMYQLLKLENM